MSYKNILCHIIFSQEESWPGGQEMFHRRQTPCPTPQSTKGALTSGPQAVLAGCTVHMHPHTQTHKQTNGVNCFFHVPIHTPEPQEVKKTHKHNDFARKHVSGTRSTCSVHALTVLQRDFFYTLQQRLTTKTYLKIQEIQNSGFIVICINRSRVITKLLQTGQRQQHIPEGEVEEETLGCYWTKCYII